jgi:hypothetical protein
MTKRLIRPVFGLPTPLLGKFNKGDKKMKLLTKAIHDKLLENGKKQETVRGTEEEIDFKPVVKLFTPDANCTWLLTEIDPDAPDIAFGLCDLGMGYPELEQ